MLCNAYKQGAAGAYFQYAVRCTHLTCLHIQYAVRCTRCAVPYFQHAVDQTHCHAHITNHCHLVMHHTRARSFILGHLLGHVVQVTCKYSYRILGNCAIYYQLYLLITCNQQHIAYCDTRYTSTYNYVQILTNGCSPHQQGNTGQTLI